MEAPLVMLPIVKRGCGGRLPMGQGHSHPAGWNCRYEPLHPLPRQLGLRVGAFCYHKNHISGRTESSVIKKKKKRKAYFSPELSGVSKILHSPHMPQCILKIMPFANINTCKLNVCKNVLGHWGQLALSKPPCMLGILPDEGCRQNIF